MLREEMRWVIDTIKAEVAGAIANIPVPIPPKPVDMDEIVRKVIAKIQSPSTEIPKKGKEK